jgi:dienelactone hydrolase
VSSLLFSFGLILLLLATGARAEINVAGRYNADGPYAVTTAVLAVPSPDGTFTTTAYIPKDAKAARPHPVVIFLSGFMQSGVAYAPYAKRLASWGIIAFLQDDPVIAYAPRPKFPDETSPDNNPATAEMAVKAVSYQMSAWLPEINADGASPLHATVDTSRIGLAGHSRGAQIALLAAEGLPGRVRGVFGLDPVDMSFGAPKAGARLTNIGIPVAFIGETVDKFSCAPAWSNYQVLYDAAASPAVAITALDADHTMFQDPANCRFCSLCTKGTANPSTVLGYSVRYLTAFFARELLGDRGVGAAFEGAGATADVKAGLIQVASK